MEMILQSILDVVGVGAAIIVDSTGSLVSHRGRSVYDRTLCEQVGKTLIRAVDTIQLQQDDWSSVTAHYADGKILLRNLGTFAGKTHVLAVVADATLNPSFATVVIRVAAHKLARALEGGSPSQVAAAGQTASIPPMAPPATTPAPQAASSSPPLANSGVTWVGTPGSTAGLSGISISDPASGSFLSRCVKELARHVGPMAKVYVTETVRRICPDAPFSLAAGAKVIEELAGQIEDADDREQFQKALKKS